MVEVGPLPDASGTPCPDALDPGFHAAERTGSGVSWRFSWPGPSGSWGWWCRR